MKKIRPVVVAVVAACVVCMSFSAVLAKEEAAKVPKAAKEDAAKTGTAPKVVKDDAAKISAAVKAVKAIAAIPKRKIPPVVLKEASAVVIIPRATKNSFMVSSGSSGGVLLVHDKAGAWSSPVFITLAGGTLGWQAVGTPMDIVLVIKDAQYVDAILKGKLTLDTKTSIEPGWLGLTVKGASAGLLKAGIASYVLSHGKFYEDVVVAGSTIQLDAGANATFYSQPKVAAADILSGKVVKPSEDIKALQKSLADYATAAK